MTSQTARGDPFGGINSGRGVTVPSKRKCMTVNFSPRVLYVLHNADRKVKKGVP